MAEALQEIDAHGLNAERFHDEILPAARPLVMRGLLTDWPAVQAGCKGTSALADYLRRHDRGLAVRVKIAPPEARGRFFYNDDLTGFNFRKETMAVSAALDILLASAIDPEPAALAIQSIQARHVLPGFDLDNVMPLLPENAAPRLWLGSAVTVAAHYDPADNIACVVAGRRRFTLFPPEQVGNLYPGPFELTIAGPIVSMVDFDAPDPVLYPKFADAMKAALVADLEPGDAIYIPCMWWHHVRSTAPVNMLVNYWWDAPNASHAPGIDALLHAMLAIKGLHEPHRAAWRALFGHYVFQDDGAPGTHLPVDRRGVQGDLTPAAAQVLRDKLRQSLGDSQAPRRLVQRARAMLSAARQRAGRLISDR
ncbi:cupin-like domain-containing protein [Sphingomonas oligophenolica]|uniref:Cupin-like domain-containing protein n=1 Tax=Sphingomonas oligophenolica TaxID=301154 RepID=A0ABU9Y5N2_9SPHN